VVWRVSDRATFEALRRRSRRARCGPVSVAFTREDAPRVPRVAYAVGRRVGHAVVRNRLRRRLRAAVGEVAGELRPGAYLVSASAGACRLSYEELRTTLARAMAAASREPGSEHEK
jgi:ribonuclease P protein component